MISRQSTSPLLLCNKDSRDDAGSKQQRLARIARAHFCLLLYKPAHLAKVESLILGSCGWGRHDTSNAQVVPTARLKLTGMSDLLRRVLFGRQKPKLTL